MENTVTIATTDDLQTYVDENEGRVAAIGNQLKDLRKAVKSGLLEPESREDRAECESIGRMVKAAARGDTGKIEELGGRAGHIAQKADLGTPLTGGDGATGYLVPTEFYKGVMRIAEEQSELMSQVTKWEMNAKTVNYPRKNAGISLTKVGTDGGQLSEGNPTFTADSRGIGVYVQHKTRQPDFPNHRYLPSPNELALVDIDPRAKRGE